MTAPQEVDWYEMVQNSHLDGFVRCQFCGEWDRVEHFGTPETIDGQEFYTCDDCFYTHAGREVCHG